jgi:hypothetical protein
MSGLKVAASFGRTPNTLGFCGPQALDEQKALREYLYYGKDIARAKKVMSKFEGAYSYYLLIAKKNNIRDPFDERVVNAYWIGNNLLEKVNTEDLKKMVLRRFTKPGLLSKEEALKRIEKIPNSAKPHHSFHVFIMGTVTGKIDLNTIKLKDICRVGWGRVAKLNVRGSKSKVIIKYQPVIRDKKIKLGKYKLKELDWDKKAVPELKIGDRVAFHWNTLTKVLTKEEMKNLKKYTQNTLNSL